MKTIIEPYNWRADLTDVDADVYAIDNDFVLLENFVISTPLDVPFKLDITTAVINLKGSMKGFINLKSYTTQAPCFLVVLPDQILQHEYISDDFSGFLIIMSRRFTDNLNIQERLPLFLSLRDNPCIPLNDGALDAMKDYFTLMQRVVRIKENPNRLEIAKHLTLAFFYGMDFWHHRQDDKKKSKHEILVEKFLNYVQAHYKEHRGVEFYADKLCLTPKYLSKVVKDTSGASANVWIDNYVVLEAKALLKSTNMTIQQIGDELNFPSQSFFGKYFKRHVGVSPSEYKNK